MSVFVRDIFIQIDCGVLPCQTLVVVILSMYMLSSFLSLFDGLHLHCHPIDTFITNFRSIRSLEVGVTGFTSYEVSLHTLNAYKKSHTPVAR